MDISSGVSETVGAILLVSLVAVLVSIIAISVFSQPVPQKIPSLNFMTGVNSTKTTLYLYHNGGDTLTVGEFSVLLDGVPASYTVAGGGNEWSLGKNLIVPISSIPQSVQLIYNNTAASGGTGSTGAILLDEASANIVSSENVSADQLPYLDCSAVRNWDCRFEIPPEIIVDRYVTNSTVQMMNFEKNNIASDSGLIGKLNSATYHFNFTVAEANSTIVWGDSDCSPTTRAALQTDDKVGIYFRSNAGPDDFVLFGMAPQIWEMAGGGLSEIGIDITHASNGTTTKITGSRLCHTYISEYKDLDSTMLIIGRSTGSSETSFIINNTFNIAGQSSSNVTFANFRPVANGMFLVSWGGGGTTPVFVIGWSDSVYKDGSLLTGAGL
ncbi:MAG: type IV pilin N-terminal domain-containing protein [Methanoregula sp.]